jgi:GTP 3',8-cyclase
MFREPLIDGHGRRISDVRVSVTDRCNFRCQYCMPADGLPWLERDDVLTFEEIVRLTTILAEMGVHDVRLTGGEPLVRRDFPRLAGMLAAIPGVEDLSVTTNGYLLERDAEKLVRAGINRFNVSIDSLQRDRFFEMTRRDALPRVLRGLEVLAAFPEAHPIKVNAVAMRGFTEDEALPFAEFARSHPYGCASSSSCRSTPTTTGRPTPSSAATRSAPRSAPCTRSSPSRARRTRRPASTASPTATARSASSTP